MKVLCEENKNLVNNYVCHRNCPEIYKLKRLIHSSWIKIIILNDLNLLLSEFREIQKNPDWHNGFPGKTRSISNIFTLNKKKVNATVGNWDHAVSLVIILQSKMALFMGICGSQGYNCQQRENLNLEIIIQLLDYTIIRLRHI